MFGQSTSTNTFGQTSAFSTSSTPFGSIGSAQPQQSSLFGQTQQSSLFGGLSQPTQNTLFSAPQTQPASTFGTQSSFGGGSLFGNTTQQTSQAQNSFFGNTNRFSVGTSNTFGANTALGATMNVPTGTTIKFQPVSSTDSIMKNGHSGTTTINIRLQCITCMREYETKSLEELRMEDYAANRKGPQQQSLFGSSTMNTGTFSTGLNNTFGQSTSNSLFNTQKTFGAPTTTTTTSLFSGSLTNNNTGIFGTNTTNTFNQPTDNKSFFGSTNTNQPLTNQFSFGQNASTSTNTSGSLFGNTIGTSSSNVFGQNTQNSFGANKSSIFSFAQTQQQPTTNLFTNTNTTGNTGLMGGQLLFNSTNKPATNFSFNQPSFNSSTSTSNVFGSTSGSTFGSNTGSLFGNTFGSNTFGSFGNSTATSQPFQNNNTGFNFNLGNTNTFGGLNTNTMNTASGLTNNTFNANNQNQSATGISMVNTDQILTRLQTLPYGTPSPISLDSSLQNKSKTKFTTDPKTLNQYKLNAKSQNEVKISRTPVTNKPTTLLFDGLDDESPDNLRTASDIFKPKQYIKKLVLNKSSTNTSTPLSSMVKSTKGNNLFNKENESPLNSTSNSLDKSSSLDNTMNYFNNNSQNKSIDNIENSTDNNNEKRQSKNADLLPVNSLQLSTSNDSFNIDRTSNSIDYNNDSPSSNRILNFVPPKCCVTLTRVDYYTIPTLDECDQFYNPDNDTCIVDNFTVGRINYGSIYWQGPLNIKGINLDEMVHIRRKEVIVYPDDDLKPPTGDGLNRPAQITLDQVWPVDKSTREFIKDPSRLLLMKYAERLEKVTVKMDATFKEYRPDTGSWVFVVKHFSKYGLDAEDEDDIEGDNVDNLKDKKAQKQNQASLVKQKFDVSNHVQNNIFKSLNDSSEHLNENSDYLNVNNKQLDQPFEYKLSNGQNSMKISNYNDFTFAFKADSDNSKTTKEAIDDKYSAMRSALFLDDDDDDDDLISKRCKNLSFTKSQISSKPFSAAGPISGPCSTSTNSLLFPTKFRASNLKKRRLTFEPKPSINKANIYSLFYNDFPKARFINGSNKFCLIVNNEVLIFEIDLIRLDQNDATEKLEKHLDLHSTIIPANNESIPPLIKTNACSLNSLIDPNMNSLIEALYGELSETIDYARHQERLRRILNWLFNFNKSLTVPQKSYNRIIHFLTTNELEFAVTECINTKLPRLSYLIACGPYCKKELIVAQLDLWKRTEADKFIDENLLNIYVILSGLSTWNLSNGTCIQPLNSLHWTQQMTLLLLYKTHTDLEMIGTNLVKTAIEELSYTPDCVEYHLLAQHQPWVAITSSKNFLDSWFLQESLLSYNVIVDDKITNKCDSINAFMASQTRNVRLALFFALHIKNDFLRCQHVKELLARNADQLLNNELELFLIEKFQLNKKFLSESKLYLSKTNRNYKEMAMNMLDIKQYKDANDVLVDKIFPELVINEDYEEISALIDKLRPYRHLLPNWEQNGAGIYDIFIQLLKFGHDDLKHYQTLLENFNVHQLRCPTNRHVLCQSQMTRVANIMHAELNKGMFAYYTSTPDDYSLMELRSNAYKLYDLKAIYSS